MFHSPVFHFYGIVDYIRPQFEFISVIPLTRNRNMNSKIPPTFVGSQFTLKQSSLMWSNYVLLFNEVGNGETSNQSPQTRFVRVRSGGVDYPVELFCFCVNDTVISGP